MHPFALAAGGDDSSAAQVGKVARDLGLGLVEDFNEVADTDFPAGQEVQEAQAGGIGQGGEELGQIRRLRGGAHSVHYIRIDRYNPREYIR